MGNVSYQGEIGGFVFACPLGSIKAKLYGSTEHFPSILFQVLQEVEAEGFVTREIYVDTHSVNLSEAAEKSRSDFQSPNHPSVSGYSARDGLCRVSSASDWTNGKNIDVWATTPAGILLGIGRFICSLHIRFHSTI